MGRCRISAQSFITLCYTIILNFDLTYAPAQPTLLMTTGAVEGTAS